MGTFWFETMNEFECLISKGIPITTVILFFGVIQLLLIVIIGVYTRKIYREIKACPLCIVESTKNDRQLINNHLTSTWRTEAAYITRFAGSGIINTIIGFIIIFFAMALGYSPMVSNVAGYAVGFTLGFVLSKKFVFRSNGHFAAESIRYLIAFAIAFLVNLLVLRLALTYMNFHAVISQIVAAVSYTLLMYILTRLYVFNTGNKGKSVD